MTRSRLRRGALALALALACLAFWVLTYRPPEYPAPVLVRLAATNTPLAVSPGIGGLLVVLPDGSLWRWGPVGLGLPLSALPAREGTDSDWRVAKPGNNGYVGIKQDGTLWQAGHVGPGLNHGPTPRPVDSDTNWIDVAKTDVAAAALKADGTLWTWGESMMFGSLGDPAVTSRTQPGQVGTNRWRRLASTVMNSVFCGITTDGQLMAWGQGGPQEPPRLQPSPLLAGKAWAEAEPNLVLGVDGVLRNVPWLLWTTAAPESSLPAVATNAIPGRFGSCLGELYEIRDDRTLWVRPLPVAGPWIRPRSGRPVRVGTRDDWVRMWGGSSNGYGLTRDGTLWAWGTDWGTEAHLTAASRVRRFLYEWINLACDRAGIGRMMGNLTLVGRHRTDRTPRPLLRMIPPPSDPGGPDRP